MSRMDDYYRAIGLLDEDRDALTHADDAAALAYYLEWVLYCHECKGKGFIWVRGGRDLECDCRTQARKELGRYKDSR